MGYFHFTPTFHFLCFISKLTYCMTSYFQPCFGILFCLSIAVCYICFLFAHLCLSVFACLLRSRNIRRNRSFLHEDTGPEPVLRSRVGTPIVKSQLADMPIRRVSRGRGTNTRNDLRQGARPIRRPEPDRLRIEVDVIGEVIPVPCFELRRPV